MFTCLVAHNPSYITMEEQTKGAFMPKIGMTNSDILTQLRARQTDRQTELMTKLKADSSISRMKCGTNCCQ